MLDSEVLREPPVKFYLNQALDMMNRAVGGTFQPGARENMAYFVSTEKRCVMYVCPGMVGLQHNLVVEVSCILFTECSHKLKC